MSYTMFMVGTATHFLGTVTEVSISLLL